MYFGPRLEIFFAAFNKEYSFVIWRASSSFIEIISDFFINSSNAQPYGILISDNGYVKTAPSTASDNRFIIHEGLKFKLIDEVDNWSRIELLDGNDGWIENNHFIKVY